MDKQTDINCNWILEEQLSEVIDNNDFKNNIYKNLDNEIYQKVKDIEINISDSEYNFVKNIDLENLPLYLSEGITAKKINSYLQFTRNTQQWIGHVIEIKGNYFKAKLEDYSRPGTFEIGNFNINQDAFDEREMVKLGAVFYLSVGYNISKGTYAKQKLIRFQRLVNWTEEEYNAALDRADDLNSNIKWEE